MNVEPGLLRHPKFLAFKRQVGDKAAEFLLRVWGHCQEKTAGFWEGHGPEYVEALCNWRHPKGKLFAALADPFGRGTAGDGFIVAEDGGLLIRDFNHVNAGMCARWKNGKHGGRPNSLEENGAEKPAGSVQVSGQEPDGNQPETSTPPNRVECNKGNQQSTAAAVARFADFWLPVGAKWPEPKTVVETLKAVRGVETTELVVVKFIGYFAQRKLFWEKTANGWEPRGDWFDKLVDWHKREYAKTGAAGQAGDRAEWQKRRDREARMNELRARIEFSKANSSGAAFRPGVIDPESPGYDAAAVEQLKKWRDELRALEGEV